MKRMLKESQLNLTSLFGQRKQTSFFKKLSALFVSLVLALFSVGCGLPPGFDSDTIDKSSNSTDSAGSVIVRQGEKEYRVVFGTPKQDGFDFSIRSTTKTGKSFTLICKKRSNRKKKASLLFYVMAQKASGELTGGTSLEGSSVANARKLAQYIKAQFASSGYHISRKMILTGFDFSDITLDVAGSEAFRLCKFQLEHRFGKLSPQK